MGSAEQVGSERAWASGVDASVVDLDLGDVLVAGSASNVRQLLMDRAKARAGSATVACDSAAATMMSEPKGMPPGMFTSAWTVRAVEDFGSRFKSKAGVPVISDHVVDPMDLVYPEKRAAVLKKYGVIRQPEDLLRLPWAVVDEARLAVSRVGPRSWGWSDREPGCCLEPNLVKHWPERVFPDLGTLACVLVLRAGADYRVGGKGYCYGESFEQRYRAQAMAMCGPYPTVRTLRLCPGYVGNVPARVSAGGLVHCGQDVDGKGMTLDHLPAHFVVGGEPLWDRMTDLQRWQLTAESVGHGVVCIKSTDEQFFTDYFSGRDTDLVTAVYVRTRDGDQDGAAPLIVSDPGQVLATGGTAGNWAYSLDFGFARACVVLPPFADMHVGNVTISGGYVRKLVFLSGKVKFKTNCDSPRLFCRVFDAYQWLRVCEHPRLLDRVSTTQRLVSLHGVDVLVLDDFDRAPPDVVEISGFSVTDREEPWLSETTYEYAVPRSKDVFVDPDTVAGFIVENDNHLGFLMISDKVVLRGNASVAMCTPRDGAGKVQVRAVGVATRLVVTGVADRYCFDGGGPSGGASHCSGEVYGEDL